MSHKKIIAIPCEGNFTTKWFRYTVMPTICNEFMKQGFGMQADWSEVRLQHDNTFLNRDNWRETKFNRWCKENLPFKVLYCRSFSPDINSVIENMGG